MSAVFSDTFCSRALPASRDPARAEARAQSWGERPIVKAESVLLELGNAGARAEDHADFLALRAGIRASSRTRLIPRDSLLLQRGLDRSAKRSDKNSSLKDCDSLVVMQDEGPTEALTGDNHLEQTGCKALLA